MALDLNKKTFLLVTGASRGIGQALAISTAAKLKPGSLIVLMARNDHGLSNTKSTILMQNDRHKVKNISIDLAKTNAIQFREILRDSIIAALEQIKNFERAIIIHNAGTVGDVSKNTKDLSDISKWQDYYTINLFSVAALNCEFFRIFGRIQKIVVNLSSKCGIEPFCSMSQYCTAKAARDMYFRVLALEEQKTDTIVLNYAPGAIDTDMTVILQDETINAELAELFRKQRTQKSMLTTDQTAERFIKVLEQQKFKSGDHVDYWDFENETVDKEKNNEEEPVAVNNESSENSEQNL